MESATIEFKKARVYNKAALRHSRLMIMRVFADENAMADTFNEPDSSGRNTIQSGDDYMDDEDAQILEDDKDF